MLFSAVVSAALGASVVYGHGLITEIQGDNGVTAPGFGVLATTPRDCAQPNPCEQDTSVIRDNAIASGKTDACGSTKAGGNNDITTQLAAADAAGLPTCAAGGSIKMTLHQVNQDGAGPYSCDVSGDGGQTFQAATVTQNVPGVIGLSLASKKDFPIEATMPAGMTCSAGPSGNACIVRCRNQAAAGPFGGCAPFTTDAAGAAPAAAGNATAAAAPATAANAAAAKPAPAAADDTGATAKGAGGALGGLSALIPGGAAAGGGAGGIAGLFGRKRQVIKSRIAGEKAGYWI